jgi:complement component 1 Q subcomponent-binding protein, mitochondrial
MFSLRLMFSIADLQSEEDFPGSEEEGAEGREEGEEEEDDSPYHSYPVRTSLSITKVRSIVFFSSFGRQAF